MQSGLENVLPRKAQNFWHGKLWTGGSALAEADFLVACFGRRNVAGNFEWGSGYLPVANANEVVLGCNVTAHAHEKPVLAALWGIDPFNAHDTLIGMAQDRGFAGIFNYPSVSLIDGKLRESLELEELGITREMAMLRAAANAGLFTMGLVANADEAAKFIDAGVNALALHTGVEILKAENQALKYMEEAQKIMEMSGNAMPLFFCGDSLKHIHSLAFNLQLAVHILD